MSDTRAELLLRARHGDEDALVALLEQHAPDVRNRLAGAIPSRWQAVFTIDDVMQQAYLDAFLGIQSFVDRGPGSFAAWLTTLARHNLLDTIRGLEAEKRGGGRQQLGMANRNDSAVALYEWLGGHSATPSRDAARNEARTALEGAISRLPEIYRRVIEQYDLECRPIDEVAAALERSIGATYMLRARAHRMLAELMGTASQYLSKSP